MLPQTRDYVQEEAMRESRAAIDALTRCTVCLLSDQTGVLRIDSNTQQLAENFWCRNFKELIQKSVDSVKEEIKNKDKK